eukprot:3936198-Rhodomonas_salina.1
MKEFRAYTMRLESYTHFPALCKRLPFVSWVSFESAIAELHVVGVGSYYCNTAIVRRPDQSHAFKENLVLPTVAWQLQALYPGRG